MYKSTGYSKVEGFCEICGCSPCDCHGVDNELRIMGTIGTHEAREEPKLASWQDRLPSFSLMQVESRLIQPENRIFLPSMQGDLHSEEGAHRENNTRRSEGYGD